MRILLLILSLSALRITAFAQGIVNFGNSPSTLVSYYGYQSGPGLISGTDQWYFALLIGETSTSLAFTGVYATNSATAPGRFVNNGVSVPNWAVGTRMFYQVVAWHSSLGPTFNPQWQFAFQFFPYTTSLVGSGIAGGTDSQGRPLPPLPLFGGSGITSGITFYYVPDLRMFPAGGAGGAGGMEFGIMGLVNSPLVIEASTNLAPQSWIALQGCTLTNGSISFSDPQWTNHPKRFYRVRSP